MGVNYSILINLVLGLLFLFLSIKSDPDPLFDYCVADVKNPNRVFMNGVPCIDPSYTLASHFATSALSKPSDISKFNFEITTTNVDNFPGLNALSLVMARIDIVGNGLVPPHSHPRASEVVILLEGSLLIGFADTQNNLYREQLRSGDCFIFPKGLIHFLYNLNPDKPALAISGLNSQDPGMQMSSFATTTPQKDLI